MQKLMSRTEFAKLAGVTPSGVTRAAKNALGPAVSGKYIDAGHESALAFIEKTAAAKTPETVIGIDPLFEKALCLCKERGRWGQDFLKAELSIGTSRAQKLAALLRASQVKTREDIIIPEKAHVRGTAAAKQKRIEADNKDLEEIVLPDSIAAFADMTIRDVIRKYGTAERFVDYLKALKEIGIMAEREIKLAEIKGQLVSRYLVQTQIIEQFDEAHSKLLRDGSKTLAIQISAMCRAEESPEDIEKFIAEKITDFIRPVKAKISKALRDG